MNYRLFITNFIMVLMLLGVSSYEMCFYYVATAHGELIRLDDQLLYASWVFIWTMSSAIGYHVIKGFWEASAEEVDPVAELVGPILLENGV